MPTRNVVITDHQAELIDRLVASGRYQNASEVLRAGLRMLERDDEDHEAKLAALRAAVQVGMDDVEAVAIVEMSSDAEISAWVTGAFEEAIRKAGG
ncbi:MAG: type II toxin-antitoxin system ParD family antitoxin [Alphaproteobacteria bacterium]|nr:type II toxin-antitoxin system ParD family antitoxin [Alphaproteobacteria bacterium]